ncbi:MAG: DNA gyrase subunit A [Alphaproteobacteria bacterium]
MSTAPTLPFSDITTVAVEDEMKRSYLDYAMSVIVARALPDARDGLKPVHRRILYGMSEGGYASNKPHKKSAKIVGEVMGNYHPHGDGAIYDSLVRMAQDFSMRVPLVDGQGNFGSIDGDPPAAMRYTESRLSKVAETLLEDIDQETVPFQPTYDESDEEPIVLPARFPNLLVNGAGGIAVGMATNIPPHNLGEVIDACCAYLDDPYITAEGLMQHVLGPDFPTGGIIMGRSGIRSAYTTGHGGIPVRGRTSVETSSRGKDREAIIIHEIPYQVNKAKLIERMAELVQEKIIEGIADIRDASDRDGMRVVIDLKKDANADVVLAQLFKFTPLESSFSANMLAILDGRPITMNLQQIIEAFVQFREEVIRKRTLYNLKKARDRAHLLVGLALTVSNIDEIIRLIRESPDPTTARLALTSRRWPVGDMGPLIALIDEQYKAGQADFYITTRQAEAILELKLQRLTGLERDKIVAEITSVNEDIRDLLHILANRPRLIGILRDELLQVKQAFATPRRTGIEEMEGETDIEDLIQREDMVVTRSHAGYVKRVPVSAYRAQRRGGKGKSAMATKAEDFVCDLFVANTHQPLLFFTNLGYAYQLKVYRLPLGNPQARGKAMINLLPLKDGEKVTTVMPMPEDKSSWEQLDLAFVTTAGGVRRNKLADFANIRSNGLIAMKLEEGEQLIGVITVSEADDLLLFTKNGRAIRFPVDDVRVFAGRTSTGVRGIRLSNDDEVIGVTMLGHMKAPPDQRLAYLKKSRIERSSNEEPDNLLTHEEVEEELSTNLDGCLSDEQYELMKNGEEFILTVSSRGYGKLTSAYEYRVTGRGGQGVTATGLTTKTGGLVGAFRVSPESEVMLVSDGGKVIRLALSDVRICGRVSQGVTLLRVDEGETLVSVAILAESEEEGEE